MSRDDLIGIALEEATENGVLIPTLTVEDIADAILAAGYCKPRTITTAEELDALFQSEGNAVILDEDGLVLQNLVGGWGSPSFTGELLASPRLFALFGPTFSVLHEAS